MTKKYFAAIIGIAVFILFIILLKTFDVQPIGPEGTRIGFANLNGFIHNAIGEHMALYKLTNILGIYPILIVAFEVIIGLSQLIKRKSLVKVDREILLIGVMYFITALLYVIFEKVVINYRPMLEPGQTFPESSFPSSHTLLSCVVLGMTLILTKYFRPGVFKTIVIIVTAVVMVVIVVGRLASGMHWFTDIVGGLIISGALLLIFDETLSQIKKRKRRRGKKGQENNE